MKYMGSKARISKHILPIVLGGRLDNQWYVEPFVGGGNMIENVSGNRIGSDINAAAIDALYLIRDKPETIPKNNTEFTEEDYKAVKANCNHWLYGYAAFSLSYGGKFFGGWRRDSTGRRDYISEAYRGAVKQSRKLAGVVLYNAPYHELEVPANSIIYCDPPYESTTGYKDKFNHAYFWQWCRNKAKEGHKVFISEYSAPADFVCLWSKEQYSSLTKNTGRKKGVERLFSISP